MDFHKRILWSGRLLFAALMLWAGAVKLADPGAFGESLYNYRLLSPALAWAGAWLVPSVELVAGLGLLFPRTRRGAWILCSLLCLGFAVFVLSAWIRGLDIRCGCFGGASDPVGPMAALRTVLLLGTALGCTLQELRQSRG